MRICRAQALRVSITPVPLEATASIMGSLWKRSSSSISSSGAAVGMSRLFSWST